ncbi:MAG TPA: isoprenylcysteine carboxylmethyltransferase family protein [Candidatus Dormibacteraeota bacterium]|nr:isoprenylcysteine carboxylmethyltransferase family protein [Candidatus Dormibacteraeota bacterium]
MNRWMVLGYGGLCGIFALEATVRRGGTAASLNAGSDDDGTTSEVVQAFVAAMILPPVLLALPGPRLPRSLAALGLSAELAGLLVRRWSMATLGAAYSRTLRTDAGQPLVSDGPYRLVRHPGYLGTLLTWFGFALTSRSAVVVGLIGLVFGRAYARRIAAEERLLRRELPGYEAYAARTKRLLPGVW